MATEFDRLVITISANTKSASEDIEKLSSRLKNLEKQAKDMDLDSLRNVQAVLQDIANIDFSKVSSSLYSVAKSFETIGKVSISKIAESAVQKLDLGKLAQENLKSVEPLASKIDETRKVVEKAGDAAQEATEKISSQETEIIKKTKEISKQVEKTTNKARNGLQKVAIKFKSLALYRVLRLALMKIQQEFSSAIQNLAQSDAGFNDAMSRISNSFTYLANSIVASIAPILEAVTPIIEILADGLAEVANLFGEIIASEAGQDTFSEAIKGSEDYAESLKKVKDMTLGIDELNVAKQDKDTQYFQEKSIDSVKNGFAESFKDLVEAIRPVFDSLKQVIVALQPLLSTISTVNSSLVPVFESLASLISSLAPIINLIAELIARLINNTAQSINGALAKVINAITKIIQVISTVYDALEPVLEVIIDVISMVIDIVANAIGVIADIVSAVLKPLAELLKLVFIILSPILETIANVLKTIISALGNVYNLFLNLIESTLPILYVIADLIASLSPVLETIAKALGGALGADPNSTVGERVFWGILSGGTSEGLRAINTANAGDSYRTPSYKSSQFVTINGEEGNNTTNVSVYIDSEQVASRVNAINDNRGTNTFREGKLSYAK